jgi:hypothetical protein
LEAILDKLVVWVEGSFGPVEFSAAASEFKLLGVPLEKGWSPSYPCLDKMSVSVNARTGGVPSRNQLHERISSKWMTKIKLQF